jgi:glycosyltransferase involved in cell wall biosynthesis
MKITVVILTKNEEKNIGRCLKSLNFCDEIIIMDDYSTDKTVQQVHKVCKVIKFMKYSIYHRKLNNDFANQRNFGLKKSANELVLFIDADEEVSKELKDSILKNAEYLNFHFQAYSIKRRDFFWNHELKYGEVKKVRKQGIIRLVHKNSGNWMGSVHEIFHTANKITRIKGYLNHYPHSTLKAFIEEVNFYSTIRAEELFNHEIKTNAFQIIFFPIFKFVYNYFINFGFLDGSAGFTYAFMMSFHSFLVRAKLYQLINK